MSYVEEAWYSLVELSEIPSVVWYKDLRESGRHSDGWRG